MRALCLGQDAVLIESLRNVLAARGHDLEVADSIREGLREGVKADLVAVDGSLARADVAVWCSQIRATPGLGTAVVLIVGCESDLPAALEAGADDFYDKASGPEVLEMRLRVAERVVTRRSVLANREARLGAIIESHLIGVVVVRAEGSVFKEANDAFLNMIGYSRADLEAGRVTYGVLAVPESRETDALEAAQLRATGRTDFREKEYRRKDGSRVAVLAGGARLDEHDLIGLVADISTRKQVETQLRQAREDLELRVLERTADLATANAELRREIQEREKLQAQLLQVQKLEGLGLLAGGIAHDFNNLLTAILGGASVALLTVPPENPARKDIETVVATAQRAANLTRQMLAYSGKGHVEIRPIELSAHVREIANLLETTIPKKVQLRLELQRDLPPIEADVAQVQQIIMNLVINGAEAIGDVQGTVLVATGVQEVDEHYATTLFAAEGLASGTYVFLEVHDTGHGMDEATKNKIFDPFFTTKFTGRGLGLAAVMGIVRGHRGAIKVYSSPGRGTTFKVFFPTSRGRAVPARRTSALDYRGQGLVLVIDDDAGVRRTVCRMLSFLGFSAMQAADGREGLETFSRHVSEIVLVILDMTMPKMNGEETFREIRRIRADTPVILTSGYSEIEATRRFTSKGLAGFLEKPFTPSDLAAKLAKVVFPKK
jgi:PAS domain S-box-containing protein